MLIALVPKTGYTASFTVKKILKTQANVLQKILKYMVTKISKIKGYNDIYEIVFQIFLLCYFLVLDRISNLLKKNLKN